MHESVFRSYLLVEKIRALLLADPPCPPKVLLEIIDDVHDAPSVELKD
jgi:hypothetical protein